MLVSAPTASYRTALSACGDESSDILCCGVQGRLTAHFPVNLFVTAIADGQIAQDTPAKIAERLSQIVRKVPKEQNTSVEVLEGNTVDLKV
jgi:hypothetical protein